jgi:hypothetical protein
VSRIRVDLQREYEIKLSELREASKRVQEQAEHHISLQKSKCESLEDEIQRLKRQVKQNLRVNLVFLFLHKFSL